MSGGRLVRSSSRSRPTKVTVCRATNPEDLEKKINNVLQQAVHGPRDVDLIDIKYSPLTTGEDTHPWNAFSALVIVRYARE
jgi:hypothetical protein